MKQFLLFAGIDAQKVVGVNGLVGDFESPAEAFVALVDHQFPGEWWQILDTKTGEVIERRHLRVNNGMIGFHKSDWIAGLPQKKLSVVTPSKAAEVSDLEAGMRAVVTSGLRAGNGHANGHATGSSDH